MLAISSGGIDAKESPQKALYREINEEIGVNEFNILKNSIVFIGYDFPSYIKSPITKKYKGQEQIWYLCKLNEGITPDLAKLVVMSSVIFLGKHLNLF